MLGGLLQQLKQKMILISDFLPASAKSFEIAKEIGR